MTRRFDVLLVLAHFRAATAYLSVIRTLAPRLRIGVLVAVVDPAYLQKTIPAQRLFLQLCQQFGASLVESGAAVQAELMIVQQYHYPAQTAADIDGRVKAAKRVGMLGLASAGLEKHDSFLSLFGIRKVYAPSARLTQFLVRERSASDHYAGVEVVEVGLPFAKYPVFPEFHVDYILAAPTVFSFHSEYGKHRFLGTVLQLLEQIPANARIAYKTHNGNARDYFAPTVHYAVARAVRHVTPLRTVLNATAFGTGNRWRAHLQKIETGMLHTAVLERAVPMTEITAYADMSLEAFLPGVGRGVIGGLSNAIWGTLYSGLPYYNCVDPTLRGTQSELLPHKSSEAFLDLNLRYFGVPYCGGEIERGVRGENIVTDDDRRGDLIGSIEEDLRCS